MTQRPRTKGHGAAANRVPRRGKANKESWSNQAAWSSGYQTQWAWSAAQTGGGDEDEKSKKVAVKGANEGTDAAEDGKAPTEAVGTTELLLNALASDPALEISKGAAKAASKMAAWQDVPEREPGDGFEAFLSPDGFLGQWVDSQGNMVTVTSTDAFEVRLEATLSRPPRADIHLGVKPVMLGGGWRCGHSILDPYWSTTTQLHWVTDDGRVSVWIRPFERSGDEAAAEVSADGEMTEQAPTAENTVETNGGASETTESTDKVK